VQSVKRRGEAMATAKTIRTDDGYKVGAKEVIECACGYQNTFEKREWLRNGRLPCAGCGKNIGFYTNAVMEPGQRYEPK